MKFSTMAVATALMMALAGAGVARADVAYISGDGGAEPWNSPDNPNAMNAVFGTGNWNRLGWSNAVSSGALTNQYSFLFIDGGDGQDAGLQAFLATNLPALQTWVSNGGSLFLNGAVWTGANINVGFGGTLQWDPSLTGAAATTSPIFNAGSGTSWTGGYFSHDVVLGSGFTTLITTSDSGAALVEKDYGLGHVIIGGITSPMFQSPSAGAYTLRNNILAYGAGEAAVAAPLPSYASMGSTLLVGVALTTLVARRRPKVA